MNMLHTVTAVLAQNPTQLNARKMVKFVSLLLSGKWQDDSGLSGITLVTDALCKDVDGTVDVLDNGKGTVAIRLNSKLDGPSMKSFKADLAAFLVSDEFKGLGTRAAKPEKMVVSADGFMGAHQDMTVAEFKRVITEAGVKVVFDSGVVSVKVPKAKQVYFGVDGGVLDTGKDAADRKAVLDIEKAKGKLIHFATFGKWTAKQLEFIGECMMDERVSGHVTEKMVKAIEAATDKLLTIDCQN
jgi:hypothetical protein